MSSQTTWAAKFIEVFTTGNNIFTNHKVFILAKK